MTNEKNKYLTIFESIPHPVILLNKSKTIDNMNLAATKLLKVNLLPGSQYYWLSRDRQPKEVGWLNDDTTIDPSYFCGEKQSEFF